MRIRRGFSLLETVLAAALLLLLLGLLFTIVLPTYKAARRGQNQSDLCQMAALALQSILTRVEEAPATGLSLWNDPAPGVSAALSVQPLVGQSDQGHAIWDSQVHLFVHSGQRLHAMTYPPVAGGASDLPSTGRPFRWDPAQLGQLLTARNGTERLLASAVKDFQVSGLSPAGLRPPLEVTLRLERASEDGGPIGQIEMSIRCTPRVRANQ